MEKSLRKLGDFPEVWLLVIIMITGLLTSLIVSVIQAAHPISTNRSDRSVTGIIIPFPSAEAQVVRSEHLVPVITSVNTLSETVPLQSSESSQLVTYRVRSGDTLSAIAKVYCLDYLVLARENGIPDPNRIYAGKTVLRLSNGCAHTPSVLVKQSVSPRESTGSGGASSEKRIRSSDFVKPKRFTSADLALIERSNVRSCRHVGNQNLRWKTRLADIARCIREEHGSHLQEASDRERIPVDLLIAVMIKESEGDPNAVSSSLCLGLMQILPSTARHHGISLSQIFDPRTNILGGAGVLRSYLDYTRGDLDRALASYNLGPGAVDKKMREEGFDPSAFDYVVKVKAILRQLKH